MPLMKNMQNWLDRMILMKNLSHAAVGDIIEFRCGGTVRIQKIMLTESGSIHSEFYPIRIQIAGYHTMGDVGWMYNDNGEHGEGTGLDGEAPFDILKIDREAETLYLRERPMKLHQLPISGDWIDPSTITGVSAVEKKSSLYEDSYIAIHMGSENFIIDAKTIQQAQAIRDEIAGWANEGGRHEHTKNRS